MAVEVFPKYRCRLFFGLLMAPVLAAFLLAGFAQEQDDGARDRLQDIEDEIEESETREGELSGEVDDLANVIADVSEALVTLPRQSPPGR